MKKLLIIMFLLFPFVLKAETADDYKINNLKISRIDKDATTARQKGITQAQRDAFNTILYRLDIDSSNGIIVSDDEISQMIRSMQIKNERITNESYSATLTMEFSPEYVKYMLNKYKITKYSPKLSSYVIVPLLNENGNTFLWERGNRWISAFRKNLTTNKNIILAEGDFSTKNTIEVDYFNRPTFSKFRNLADLYNVNNVVVVIGDYSNGGDIIETKIHVMDSSKTKNATMSYQVENLNNVNSDFSGAAVKIIDYIDDLTEKEEPKAPETQKLEANEIYIFVPLASIRDYNNADNLLKINRNITDLKMKMINKKMAIYSVRYLNGNLVQLIDSLKYQGFLVNEKKDGLYLFLQ